jgi:hypothetical protein
MIKEIPELLSSPLEAISRVHELRNFLHPGKCLRHSMKIEEKTSKLSVGLAYVSLLGVLDYYQGEPVEYADVEVPAPIRKVLGWLAEVEPLTTELALEAPKL